MNFTCNTYIDERFSIGNTESSTIALLRLPLALLIVLMHLPCNSRFEAFFAGELGNIAVPFFFCISGFLFFDRAFSWNFYFKQVHSRFYSLVIPYVFWNVIALFIVLCIQLYMTKHGMTPKCKLIVDYNFFDWLREFAVWPLDTMPRDYPLWYLRDLMLLVIISPFLFLLLYSLRHAVLPILLACIFLSDRQKSFSLFFPSFFVLGGYLRKYYPYFMTYIRSHCKICIGLYLGALFLQIRFSELSSLAVLYGLGAWCAASYYIPEKYRNYLTSSRAGKFSFFLYCSHVLIRNLLSYGERICKFCTLPSIITYFLSFFSICIISFLIFLLLERSGEVFQLLCMGKRRSKN